MPTTTTNIGLTKPTVGADTDSWGTYLNSSLDVIDGIFKADGTGTSVGLKVGTGKVLSVTGTCTINSTSSTIDGAVIGGTTPAAGTFTNLTATNLTASGGTLTLNPTTTGAIDKVNIGATTPGSGAFTTGSFSGNVTAPTQAVGDSSTKVATTAFAHALTSIAAVSVFLTTPGTSTTTVPAGASRMRAIIVGGGATGEAKGGSGADVFGGGAGATAIWERAVTAGDSVSYTVAAAVTVASGNQDGTNGNASSVSYGGDTVTAGGGKASPTLGAGGTVSTVGTGLSVLSVTGQAGGYLHRAGTGEACTGYASGGSSLYGFGAPAAYRHGDTTLTAYSSANGVGYGGGGAGHLTNSAGSAQAGGGAQGLIILQFFA